MAAPRQPFVSLGVVVFGAVCACLGPRVDVHAADGPGLRLPRWIEAIREPADVGPTAAPRAGIVPVAAPKAAATPTPARVATPVAEDRPVRRWLTERMAALPKPAGLLPAAKPEPTPPAELKPAPRLAPTPAAETTADAEPATPSPDTTPDQLPTLAIDAASFKGASPGTTTRAELLTAWGPGETGEREDGTTETFWTIEPFEKVEVNFDGETVASIRIKLAEPVAVGDLARQLQIADLRTVSIRDEQGVAIGEVYPERGVILSVQPGTQSANAIMIEPLDPESFVLRAEGAVETSSADATADLLYAIQLDPRHVRAHRLLLTLVSEQGKWTQALALAEQAAALDPADAWTEMKRAAILLELDRPSEARGIVEGVLAREATSPLVTAQAKRLLGRAALAGPQPDHQAAVEHFAEVIRQSAPLVAKGPAEVQPAAREVMLAAHLGTARAIAEGSWQQKERVIPKWIARSEKLVTEFQGGELERMILELQLCRGALTAAAGTAEAVDPMPWVKRMLELRDRMAKEVADPWRRRQVDWEVGRGLDDALAAAQVRGDATDMLDNATLTAAFLERGAKHRELTDTERRDYGELLFRIGIMHSLQKGDHATAVTWFDRVLPLWQNNDSAGDTEAGRLGESYVSMAISYWQVERREEAVTLNRRGIDLMVAAVDRKQLEERALAVAYGNLATMYAEEGDEDQSRTYAEMATRAESTGTTLR